MVDGGLYIHFPWCVKKCPYCDFYSVEAEGEDLAGFVDAMLVEIERRAPEAPCWHSHQWPVEDAVDTIARHDR